MSNCDVHNLLYDVQMQYIATALSDAIKSKTHVNIASAQIDARKSKKLDTPTSLYANIHIKAKPSKCIHTFYK